MEETMLIFVDTTNNNNKFYHVTRDGDKVVKRWGRVGQDGSKATEFTGEHGYHKIINAKKKRGYTEAQVETASSKNSNTELNLVAQNYLAADPTDNQIVDLISKLVSYNQYQIMEQSGGQITVNQNGSLTTALGVVNIHTINKARTLLKKLHSRRYDYQERKRFLEQYLMLIPQPVNFRTQLDDWLSKDKVISQTDFLDQLENSVKFASVNDADGEELDLSMHADLFRMRLSRLDDVAEFSRIKELYESTKHAKHSSSRMELVNVYVVTDTQGEEVYEQAKKDFGNVRELWHGTKVSNLLSILKSGLYVPPVNGNIPIVGRMFGNGIYSSDMSSKALNYATGFWGGARMKQNCFMLLMDIVMGHEFRPSYWNSQSAKHAYTGVGKSGKPYQSISVKGGTCSVLNNEMIVWNTDQIKIKYLCEFAE